MCIYIYIYKDGIELVSRDSKYFEASNMFLISLKEKQNKIIGFISQIL